VFDIDPDNIGSPAAVADIYPGISLHGPPCRHCGAATLSRRRLGWVKRWLYYTACPRCLFRGVSVSRTVPRKGFLKGEARRLASLGRAAGGDSGQQGLRYDLMAAAGVLVGDSDRSVDALDAVSLAFQQEKDALKTIYPAGGRRTVQLPHEAERVYTWREIGGLKKPALVMPTGGDPTSFDGAAVYTERLGRWTCMGRHAPVWLAWSTRRSQRLFESDSLADCVIAVEANASGDMAIRWIPPGEPYVIQG
jgi:hypothetical protein